MKEKTDKREWRYNIVVPIFSGLVIVSRCSIYRVVSPSQLYLALIQCEIMITWTEVFFLWTRYQRGQKLSWIDLLAECGGLSNANIQAFEDSIFVSIENELRKWESYARYGIEDLEARTCNDQDLLSHLLYRPRKAQLQEGPFTLSLDDNQKGDIEVDLQVPIKAFLWVDQSDTVKLNIEIPQLQNMTTSSVHPIFGNPALLKIASILNSRKKELCRYCVALDCNVREGLTKEDFKYALVGIKWPTKIHEDFVNTVFKEFPSTPAIGLMTKVLHGRQRLNYRSFLEGVTSARALLLHEKNNYGINFNIEHDLKDVNAILSQIASHVFKELISLQINLDSIEVENIQIRNLREQLNNSIGVELNHEDLYFIQSVFRHKRDGGIDLKLFFGVLSCMIDQIQVG